MVNLRSTPLVLASLAAALTTAGAVREMFDQMVRDDDIEYTPAELTQHLAAFSRKLSFEGLEGVDLSHAFRISRPALMESVAAKINAMQDSWVASADQPRFRGASLEDAAALMGAIPDQSAQACAEGPIAPRYGLQVEFDARDAFPECAKVIGNIRDQSKCGNCWSIPAVSAFNDRLCIATGEQVQLSAMHATSCCNPDQGCSEGDGCEGGKLIEAWRWFGEHGLVTGGEHLSSSGCWPYPFEMCWHYQEVEGIPKCPTVMYQAPACSKDCPNKSYKTSFDGDRHYTNGSPCTARTVAQMQSEITNNGPVTAGFYVYEDFLQYKTGVYVPTSPKLMGYHIGKIIGWGKEDSSKYWLVANSWNAQWGDRGFFKIRQGVCGIEKEVVFANVARPVK